ncbi:hypothetical protein BT63DRAFT_85531 [Microthyrium microscopicum]|uniref:Ubiquitin-like domain-containing protein n=1 Tax=Microthyrium microscopicum TaxID=703497 RepID=A0A6A6U0C8_9PEZI|nr:hypothetical protein BT63DRAFT_85531 [Microthyrium microscopicum]
MSRPLEVITGSPSIEGITEASLDSTHSLKSSTHENGSENPSNSTRTNPWVAGLDAFTPTSLSTISETESVSTPTPAKKVANKLPAMALTIEELLGTPPKPDDRFIDFKDMIGRTFKFPFKGVRRWKDMKSVIQGLFVAHQFDGFRLDIFEGRYDIVNEQDNMHIIAPFWESLLKPGDKIKMAMWPNSSNGRRLLEPRPPGAMPMPMSIPAPPPAPGTLASPSGISMANSFLPPPPPPMSTPGDLIGTGFPPIYPYGKKKSKHSSHGIIYIPPPPPDVSKLNLSEVEVIDRAKFEAEDLETANQWVKELAPEYKGQPILRAPGMFRAPSGFRDAFKMKSEVLCGLLGLSPYHSATFIVHMLCKAEKSHYLRQEQWPDIMIVLLQTICEDHLHSSKHGIDRQTSQKRLSEDSVLMRCYRRGLLPLPEKGARFTSSTSEHRHREILRTASAAMNIWCGYSYVPVFVLNPAEDDLYPVYSDSGEQYASKLIDLNGLDIASLLKLEGFKITWTDIASKHLQLMYPNERDDTSERSYDSCRDRAESVTLYIYWFDFTEYEWLNP